MTLQQLKYVLAVADSGSFRGASKILYMSQPTISSMVCNLEQELGITIFERTGKGVIVTPDGRKVIEYAKQIACFEEEFLSEFKKDSERDPGAICVSSHHFAVVRYAFVQVIRKFNMEWYRASLRETMTSDILQDVAVRRSEVGFISLKHSTRKQLLRTINQMRLEFHALSTGSPCVFLHRSHPLATRAALSLDDLAPYPCVTFDQEDDPLYLYSEEPVIPDNKRSKTIFVSDFLTLDYVCEELDAYTLGTGWLLPEQQKKLTAIPLNTEGYYDFGYILPQNAEPGKAVLYMIDQVKTLSERT